MSTIPSPDQDLLWSQLMALAEFREPDQPGWTRRVFFEPYRKSRNWTAALMAGAGLEVRRDPVGNLLGELPGADPQLPQIVIGSHTDTVAGGGRFDGVVGVVGAIEVVRLLSAVGRPLRHPLLVVDFLGEEPNRFGLSCLGSRAVTGQLHQDHLRLRDENDLSLGEALLQAGGSPDELECGLWRRQRLLAYLELHIEQGSRLERAGIPLGVVSAISGIHRAVITITGRPDHAGTAAMDERRDALAAAAEVVLSLERLAAEVREGASGVGTVGRLELSPGAANVVPGWARAWAELRSTDSTWLAGRHLALEASIREMAAARRVGVEVDWVSAEPPVGCAPGARLLIAEAAAELGYRQMELSSGASHDAAQLARLCPVGMIFIPSRDGRSHCPEEWSEPEQVARGVSALLAAVLRLDRADSL